MIVEINRTLRKIGFQFDAMAAFLMCQQHGVDLNQLDSIPKSEYTPSWVWSAHRSYCILRHKKPMSYDKMKVFISMMRKSEWDAIIESMASASAPESKEKDNKKKVQPGMNSSSQDYRQE